MDMKFGFVGSGGVSIDFGYIDMSLFILLVDKGKFIRDVLYWDLEIFVFGMNMFF